MQLFDSDLSIEGRTPHCSFALPRALLWAKIESDLRAAQVNRAANVAIIRDLTNHRRRFKDSDSTWLREAKDLVVQSNLPLRDYESSIDHLDSFAQRLRHYHIQLFHRILPMKAYSLKWEANAGALKQLYIAVHDNHFDAFVPCRRTITKTLCQRCHKPYGRLIHHQCKFKCHECHRFNCTGDILPNPDNCPDCNKIFHREGCFDAHLTPRANYRPICQRMKKCPDCNRDYNVSNLHGQPHICGQTTYCHMCNSHSNPRTHNCCWIPPTDTKKNNLLEKQQKFKVLFYDFEACQTRDLWGLSSLGRHVVNFAYFTRACHRCIQQGPEEPCENCGFHKFGHFKWDGRYDEESLVVRKFLNLVLQDRTLDGTICIAHNAGRYDLHFVIGELLKLGITPKVIKNQMTIKAVFVETEGFNRIVFKDSFAFTPVALAKLPGAFGFQDQCKGYFPHFFNHPDSYGVVLPRLPDARYYGPEHMTVAAAAKFREWYEEHQNDPFDFDAEILKYCRNDVLILHQGISRYMTICQGLTDWNPIYHCTTFASFAAFLLRMKYMRPNQIGIIPEQGYISNDVQSKMATQYIRWLEFKRNVQYQHFLRGNEYRFWTNGPNGREIRVDAFLPETNTVVEVLGCFYHSCPRHSDPIKRHPLLFKSNQTVHAETMDRLKLITDHGYNLEIVWEHDIQAALKADPEMRHFFKTNHCRGRLLIRDAFIGARSQNYVLKARPDPTKGQKIVHLDQNSQYPYVLCNMEMPEGQPSVITRGVMPEDIQLPLTYKGFYMIDILPPRDLRFPVIPWRNPMQENKLYFTLCRSCAENSENVECTHEDEEERVLPVVVCHSELEVALQKGYRVLRVHEIWHWDRWFKDLFKPFLSTFIKVKMEASGWPRENMTEEEKDQMIQDLFENEGIQLEKDRIILNEALRYIAKLIINSSWGKYGEKPGKDEVAFFAIDDEAYWDLIQDETIEIKTQFILPTHTMVAYRKREEFAPPVKFTNCAIAALTTAAGRLQLYKVIDRVGDRLLYCDTDSAIFISEPGKDNVDDLKGPYLGKWQDELPEGFEMTEFVATGSKSYSYRLLNPTTLETREILKSKGVTVDARNADVMNFASLEGLVDNLIEGDGLQRIETRHLRFKKTLFDVTSQPITKQTRTTMTKLRFFPDYSTLPYGYREVGGFAAVRIASKVAFRLERMRGEGKPQ